MEKPRGALSFAALSVRGAFSVWETPSRFRWRLAHLHAIVFQMSAMSLEKGNRYGCHIL